MFGKSSQEQANLLAPELLQYQDMSDPLRTKSRQAYRINAANARNFSGGNIGNVRANLSQASAEDFERQQAINNEEVSRSLQIQNANVGLKNNFKVMNAQEKARVAEINAMNSSKKSEYLGKGLEGLQDYANTQQQNRAIREQNDILAGSLENGSYKWNPTTRKWETKAQSK